MTDLQKGLVGHWTMDDADTSGGVLYDSSAYDNHGTLRNTVTTGSSGQLGESYSFEGGSEDGYIEIDNSNSLSSPKNLTVSARLYLNSSVSETGNIFSKQNDEYRWRIDSDRSMWFLVQGPSGQEVIKLADTVPIDEWFNHSVVVDFSIPELRFYLNGDLVNSEIINNTEFSSSNANVYIGTYDGGSEFWNGEIDDIRVYNRVLSENEVRALYNMRSQRQHNTLGTNEEDLLLHLNARVDKSVDESNNRWYDISGNNHEAHGTSGDGTIDDGAFPEWEPTNGGRFNLDQNKGWNVPGPIETSGQVTLESWFYKDSLTDTEYLSDGRNGSGNWHLTNYSNHNVNFGNNLQADDPETHQNNSNWWNQWTHLVATSDGSTSQLFIDGQQITDGRLKSSDEFSTGIGEDFAIANRYTGSSHLRGYMSVYRIYDTILSPAQVKANYNSEKMYYK